jgi:hypothetical protein
MVESQMKEEGGSSEGNQQLKREMLIEWWWWCNYCRHIVGGGDLDLNQQSQMPSNASIGFSAGACIYPCLVTVT